jgi:HK97 family phage portal protein
LLRFVELGLALPRQMCVRCCPAGAGSFADADPHLAYDVTEITSVFGGAGRMRRLLQGEVLHLRDRSDDGLLGRSRLQRAATAVSAALQTQEFANVMWQNGAHPSGAVKINQRLSAEQKDQLRESIRQMYQGSKNAAIVLILDQGVEWESISVSPEDQELLASRRFSVEEMCRIYGVPPVIVGDLSNASFTNAETLLRYFVQFTLRHWTRKLEAEIMRTIFSEAERASMGVEFDMSDFLRGDPKSRWETHKIAIDAGILDRNEIREIEGYNPRPESAVSP